MISTMNFSLKMQWILLALIMCSTQRGVKPPALCWGEPINWFTNYLKFVGPRRVLVPNDSHFQRVSKLLSFCSRQAHAPCRSERGETENTEYVSVGRAAMSVLETDGNMWQRARRLNSAKMEEMLMTSMPPEHARHVSGLLVPKRSMHSEIAARFPWIQGSEWACDWGDTCTENREIL